MLIFFPKFPYQIHTNLVRFGHRLPDVVGEEAAHVIHMLNFLPNSTYNMAHYLYAFIKFASMLFTDGMRGPTNWQRARTGMCYAFMLVLLPFLCTLTLYGWIYFLLTPSMYNY